VVIELAWVVRNWLGLRRERRGLVRLHRRRTFVSHSMRVVVAALVVVAANCSGSSSGDPTHGNTGACTFTNPLGTGADPWVVRRGDAYYFAESRNNAIWVHKTGWLTTITSGGVAVWTPPATGWNQTNIWAPELHFIDGHWYIYYAAGSSGPPFIAQRAGVLQSVTDDPQGSYTDLGMLYTGDDVANQTTPVWAIDLTVHRINGQLYAVWSGWEQNASTDRTPQHLYIAAMSDPHTISSNRVKLSSPVESWEVGTELNLQEGPEFLEHAGQIFIIYSARESWLPDYRLGQLRLTNPADPMSPGSWVKSGPVFSGSGDAYGVGHASFTTSLDSTEDWIVYHTKVSPSPGWDRVIRTQKFTWNADGSPNFGVPVPSSQVLPMPSGQCKP
jgi:GH43 family beta-xylosidase